MKKRMSARRAATFLAALGALVMSSGVALMATATTAHAAPDPKIVVCKYVSTPGGELDHIVVVSDNTLPDEFNGTFPFEWTDAQGQSTVGSIAVRFAAEGEQAKDVPLSDCPGGQPEPEVCPDGTDHAGETIPEGETAESFCDDVTPPEVCPDGTDNAGQEIPVGQTAAEFCDDASVVVSPPTGTTPHQSNGSSTVTPTVVHAGLAGATAQDLRSEQGLALVAAGMMMLLAAGGLGLRRRGVAARI